MINPVRSINNPTMCYHCIFRKSKNKACYYKNKICYKFHILQFQKKQHYFTKVIKYKNIPETVK